MICINVAMKFSGVPLKRTPVEIILDDKQVLGPTPTDRTGKVCFDIPVSSGKVIVAGVERYQGRLDGEVDIELWNLTESGNNSEGASSDALSGSNAYHNMTTRQIIVNGNEILTDGEGYMVNPGEWSEEFVRQLAAQEGLELNSEHWEVIRFIRDWYADHGHQASVRDMIKHFRKLWGCDRGCNHYMHKLFPKGGPQKQGNRLAGLLRTKGEH
ncbi:TusE/DsrC/DsvC family sulfur relay protein [uncultured Cocleimonas sp.]|uniref:TusE/DsrC/DsvC family sulfur relay protein n=1 Tax=uncultured Cocleimonas sp. TaxID=1051587 RepID=UPI002617F91B|nr:TusE/DsrC/DsvC family sulfur relay protein [uncultured Cocleimonas sp.]